MQKNEVLKAYKEKKTATINSFPLLTDDWSYFRKIESAIDSYYTDVEGVSDACRAVVRGAFNLLSKAEMKCSDDEKYGIIYPSDLQVDIDDKWYAWQWLNESLIDKVKYTMSEASAQSTTEGITESEKVVDAEQPELEIIVEEIQGARAAEKEKLDALAESYWQGTSKMDFVCLLENRGQVEKTPDKEEIVKKLYLDYGVLEQINKNGLDVYIPSYLR